MTTFDLPKHELTYDNSSTDGHFILYIVEIMRAPNKRESVRINIQPGFLYAYDAHVRVITGIQYARQVSHFPKQGTYVSADCQWDGYCWTMRLGEVFKP